MKKKLLSLLLFSLSSISYSQGTKKLLFIGIDGCRSDVVMSSNTPAIHSLLPTAIYSTEGLCAYKTWSGNGWSSMLTGVWHTKHGVTDNTFVGSNYANYPDFIKRMELFNSNLKTISCVHWGPINTTIIQDADIENTYATDLAVKNGAIAALTTDNPDVLFVDFDDVDHAGHTYGFSSTIPQYVASIETTDSYIAEILTALHNRATYASEDWLVVLTTDHGGNLAGHGRGSLAERTIFNIYSNPNLAPQQLSRNVVSQTENFNETNLFSGTYAQPTNQAPFAFGATQDFTIEFWVKATAYTSDPALISNKNWNSGANTGFVISATAGQFWKVNVSDGVDRLDIEGGYLEPNVWHHLAVSFDRDGLMTAYEDGAVVGFEKMQNIGSINSGLPFTINQDGTTTYNYNFQGSYKDIRVWNTVIPNDIIVNWATQPITNAHPYYNQLLANWKCNETSGTVLTDTSINVNNSTIIGTVTRQSNVNNTFSIFDYSNTTREPDNAVTALTWMCVPIQPSWNLDGVSRVPLCAELAVETSTSANKLRIFPNPSNNEITIEGLESESDYVIYNSVGQAVQSGTVLPKSTIKISTLSKGLYYLSINDLSIILIKG